MGARGVAAATVVGDGVVVVGIYGELGTVEAAERVMAKSVWSGRSRAGWVDVQCAAVGFPRRRQEH